MKPASLIRYDIRNLEKKLLPGCMPAALRPKVEATLAKKKAELQIAERREFKRLAKVLTFKADIYGPNGRIYSHMARWAVSDEGQLMHGTTIIDPATLTDGNGRVITPDLSF